jgi:threonine/homoserine/homoserine lactone efflux protein
MEFGLHILLGIITTYISYLAPGMLNMTAVQVAIDNGTKKAAMFSIGSSIVIAFQASIALLFANYLHQHPELLNQLEVAGLFVFFALAIFFFVKTRFKFKYRKNKQKGNFMLRGVGMSFMNMLAIPFYLGIGTYLATKDLLIMETSYVLFFALGTLIGAGVLFYSYIFFAKIIKEKANFIARNMNYILSGLFLFLGVLTWLK